MGRVTAPRFIIGDADALIALSHHSDQHHLQAQRIVQELDNRRDMVIFPVTAIAEAITTLHRKLNNPTATQTLIRLLNEGKLDVATVDDSTLKAAEAFFSVSTSKKHTFFDAIVCALAHERQAGAIFSFDRWYTKQGFQLLS